MEHLVYNLTACNATVSINGYIIVNPSLIPTCILAVVIGVYGFLSVRAQKPARGYATYSLTFLMYGFMMTSAMFADCLSENLKPFTADLSAIIDAGLSSSIAVSFAFNGLVDLGLLNESHWYCWVMELTCFATLFVSWIVAFIHQDYTQALLVLYRDVIAISCGFYLVTQVFWFFKKGPTGFLWIFWGGLAGAIGLGSVFSVTIASFWCTWLGAYSGWLGPSFVWFILSDVSVYCLVRYWLARSKQEQHSRFPRSHVQFELLPATTTD